jgi:hypothetical protein
MLYLEKLIVGVLVSNSLHGKKTVQMFVQLAYEGDVLFCLYILLEVTLTPAVIDIAKRRRVFLLRHFRSADKQLSGLGTDIAVTCCVICYRLVFGNVSVCE